MTIILTILVLIGTLVEIYESLKKHNKIHIDLKNESNNILLKENKANLEIIQENSFLNNVNDSQLKDTIKIQSEVTTKDSKTNSYILYYLFEMKSLYSLKNISLFKRIIDSSIIIMFFCLFKHPKNIQS